MIECIICKSQNFTKISKIKKLHLLMCKTCSYTCLFPLPTQNELETFYEREYRDLYSNAKKVTEVEVENEYRRSNAILKHLKFYISSKINNILDIGCSTGVLLNEIGKLVTNPNLDGIEFNVRYKKYALLNYKINNIFSQNIIDFEPPIKYDLVTIVHVLEHLRNPLSTIKKISNILIDNGLLYIEVPNIKTPYNNLFKRYFQIYHLHYFSDNNLQYLLESNGFEICKKIVQGTSIAFIAKKSNSLNSTNSITKFDRSYFVKLLFLKYQIRYYILQNLKDTYIYYLYRKLFY